jgi:hypothetical protein
MHSSGVVQNVLGSFLLVTGIQLFAVPNSSNLRPTNHIPDTDYNELRRLGSEGQRLIYRTGEISSNAQIFEQVVRSIEGIAKEEREKQERPRQERSKQEHEQEKR